jgi:hypothetical protein
MATSTPCATALYAAQRKFGLIGAKLSTNVNLHRDDAHGRNFEMMRVFGFLNDLAAGMPG